MKSTLNRKHIPQRTCLACRQVKAKRELIRLVRITNGSVEIDNNGKKSGRGAYICQEQECWEVGLKGGRLEHALRTNLTHDNLDKLVRYGNDLMESISGKGI